MNGHFGGPGRTPGNIQATGTGAPPLGEGGPRGPGGGGHGGIGMPGADIFSFTITDGVVSTPQVTLPNGTTVALRVPDGLTWSLQGTDVVSTRSDSSGSETVRYSDTDGDGLYQVVSASRVMTTAPVTDANGFSHRETLDVTIVGGVVTGVSETHGSTTHVLLSETVVPTAVTWAVNGSLLVESRTLANGDTHWEVFRDGNADGKWTEVASGFGTVDLVGIAAATDAVAAQL